MPASRDRNTAVFANVQLLQIRTPWLRIYDAAINRYLSKPVQLFALSICMVVTLVIALRPQLQGIIYAYEGDPSAASGVVFLVTFYGISALPFSLAQVCS